MVPVGEILGSGVNPLILAPMVLAAACAIAVCTVLSATTSTMDLHRRVRIKAALERRLPPSHRLRSQSRGRQPDLNEFPPHS